MLRLSSIILTCALTLWISSSDATAQVTSHTLRGVITEAEAGVSGIQVILSGARADTATTDTNGEFVFVDLPNGSYTLTPVSDQYRFDPEQHTLTLSPGGGSLLPVFNATTATSVDGVLREAGIALFPNAPNPFNHRTLLRYRIEMPGDAQLAIYDVLGRHITTLRDAFHGAGLYEIAFVPVDLPAGLYFFRLTTPHEQLTRSMVLTN